MKRISIRGVAAMLLLALAATPSFNRVALAEDLVCCGGSDTAKAVSTRRRAGTTTVSVQKVPTKTRQAYNKFWKKMPAAKAQKLEVRLMDLTRRANRGENVRAEVGRIRAEHPQLFQLSKQLKGAKFQANNGNQQLSCVGLGWIGRNGRLRCIGKLTM